MLFDGKILHTFSTKLAHTFFDKMSQCLGGIGHTFGGGIITHIGEQKA